MVKKFFHLLFLEPVIVLHLFVGFGSIDTIQPPPPPPLFNTSLPPFNLSSFPYPSLPLHIIFLLMYTPICCGVSQNIHFREKCITERSKNVNRENYLRWNNLIHWLIIKRTNEKSEGSRKKTLNIFTKNKIFVFYVFLRSLLKTGWWCFCSSSRNNIREKPQTTGWRLFNFY